MTQGLVQLGAGVRASHDGARLPVALLPEGVCSTYHRPMLGSSMQLEGAWRTQRRHCTS